MRLLRILREAITTCVLVLFGIVAGKNQDGAPPMKVDIGETGDGEKTENTKGKKNPRCGDPVDVVTGIMVAENTDFELPGLIPLVWSRSWYSDSQLIGHLGHGMRSSFEMGLDINKEEHMLAVYLADGCLATFPQLLPGKEYFHYQEALLLRREADHYRLFDPKTQYSYLLYPSENGYMQYKLGIICNEQGHKITVEYNKKGYISKITDSVGRELTVITNDVGRITQVALGDHVLVQYRYNEAQDLTEVIDAAGQSAHMKYRNHLLVKRTDRNKNSFYWEYEKQKIGARVIKTWGDENVLAVHIEYNDDERFNIVTDSLGVETEYHYDERFICTKIVYADGSEKHSEYNEQFELVSETDEEGRKTSYTYDHWSQITGITYPDESKVAFEYDKDGRLISSTNSEGANQSWVYNDDGTLQSSFDENGMETTYTYNENKMVESVTNAKGDTVHLTYDKNCNLCQVTLPDGASSRWEYDNRGNCLSDTNPLGAVQRFHYDELNRLVRVNLADGNEIQLQYNAYDDVVHALDKQTEVAFEYTILGNLRSRTQGGRKVEFKYDTEERLESVTNEKSEIYQFERDLKGAIVKEVSFDKVTRTYERDLSGLVQKINRPDNRWTEYEYDQIGNIIRADYHDGTWDSFRYDKNGELIEAANQHTALRFERNPAGQVVKEWQDEHWIKSEFDELGNRLQVSSSLGANITIARDTMGQATCVKATQQGQSAWKAKYGYNELGLEIERMLPGDVISRWQYDSVGRPVDHHVRGGQRDIRRCTYDWDINDRLKKMTNRLTGSHTTYGYDEFSNLVWADGSGRFGFINRATDEVGNIYETEGKTDRIYGAGSRLEQAGVNTKDLKSSNQNGLATNGTSFEYDAEGNLAKKIEPHGDIWQYEYFGNGMLAKVIKPNGTEIKFKYDSLGRRIEKQTAEKTKRFVWDGDNPLHEWEDENLVTWVFGDDFVPTAKITNDGSFSIVNDYLGTPVEAYDEAGERVWSAELDIYGRVLEFTGKVDFMPFRYQGQYTDVETGLYYNRFRYYDPAIGQYTQPDPIGLEGGNPTPYGYTGDPNIWSDPFGLWIYYQLIDNGKVIYHGITNRGIQQRLIEHARGYGTTVAKNFNQVRFIDNLSKVGARNLEGSALRHAFKPNSPPTLKNALRRATPGYYHSYNPTKLARGRSFLSPSDIVKRMQNSTLKNVNKRGVIKCP